MYESVAKLLCGEVTVAKLPCGKVTSNHYRTRMLIEDTNHVKKSRIKPVLLNTARNYKVLKIVQRTTRYYKELQDTFKRSTK